MKKILQKLYGSKGFVWLTYFGIRFYLRLIRIRIENEPQWQRHIEQGGGVILCVFHQHFFSLIRHYKTYERFNPCIMISKSKDGDIIAPVAKLTGWQVARGSSSRGGKDAMEEMIMALKNGSLGTNIVDGPTGPIGKVKPGVVKMAQSSGALMVPCVVIPQSFWQFNSWDRFFIPKPFSRVTVRYLRMVKAESLMTREEFERTRAHLETIMAPYLCR